jgi:hypothetical protein
MKGIRVIFIAFLVIAITCVVTADSGPLTIDSKITLSFIATSPNGHAMSSENIMLYGAGSCMNTAAASSQFCNIVQVGSTYDLTVGSITTAANEHFIQTDSTNPVFLNYEINVKPYSTKAGQIPATGSVGAYIKAHMQENGNINNTVSQEVTHSDSTSATGMISGFSKKIQWQFG